MKSVALALALAPLFIALPGHAADAEFEIRIVNHRFEPSELKVPAQQKIRLRVTNVDKSAEEFESKELKREKVIPGGATATIVVGPLKPGRYPFFGEFHEDTAKGVLIVE